MWDKIKDVYMIFGDKERERIGYAETLWFLIVIVFRVIVVSTVGTAVYGDEQSEFRCSTEVIGCNNVCFDKFSKISHIRFWAFQLLAVIAPAIVFHLYARQYETVRKKKASVRKRCPSNESVAETGDLAIDTNRANSENAIPSSEDDYSLWIVEDKTDKERFHHIVSVILRFLIDAVSLLIACLLFNFPEETVTESYQSFGFIFIKTPQVYICVGENVENACGQQIKLGERAGYVPCWVSRPWEKTIFMLYMNCLSVICCILSGIELVLLISRPSRETKKRRQETAPYFADTRQAEARPKQPYTQPLHDEGEEMGRVEEDWNESIPLQPSRRESLRSSNSELYR